VRETARARQGWLDYLALGDQRSLEKLVEQYQTRTEAAPTKQLTTVKRWSRVHGWSDRLRAHANEIERELRLAQTDAIREMNERHATIAKAATGKLVEWLQRLDGGTLTVMEAARLLDVAVRVERLARGEPTDRPAVEHRGPDGGPIQIEQSHDEQDEFVRALEVVQILAAAGALPGIALIPQAEDGETEYAENEAGEG
jgi:hypothetical protein